MQTLKRLAPRRWSAERQRRSRVHVELLFHSLLLKETAQENLHEDYYLLLTVPFKV